MNTFTLQKWRRAICAVFLLAFLLIGCAADGDTKAAETHIEVLERICNNLIAAEIYDGRQQCAVEIDDTSFLENIQTMLTGGMAKGDVQTAMGGFPVVEEAADSITWALRDRSVDHWAEVMLVSFRNDKLSRIALENR